MATHSNILAWEIPWTEKPGMSQSVRYDLATKQKNQVQALIKNIFLNLSKRDRNFL